MKKKTLFGLSVILITSVFTACDFSYFDDETDDFKWNGSVKAPLGYVTYTLSELFEELDIEELEEDTNGTLSFSYTESIDGGTNTAFDVKVGQQGFANATVQPFGDKLGVLSSITVLTRETFSLPEPLILKQTFPLSKKLTQLIFENGFLFINLSSDYESDAEITLKIPSLSNGEETYESEGTIVSSETDPQQIKVNLSEYPIADMTIDGEGNTDVTNTLFIELEIEFTLEVGDVINATDKITYGAILSGLPTNPGNVNIDNGPSTLAVFGDFSDESFNLEANTIALDFFEEFGDGGIAFADASMTLSAKNGYGFPIGINLSGISGDNGDGTEKTVLEYRSDDTDELLAGANYAIINEIETYSPTAQPAVTDIVLNKDNSNLNALLNSQPTRFNIEVLGKANPANNTLPSDLSYVPNENFFATTNEGLALDVTINAPLNVKFTELAISPEPIEDLDLGEDLDNFSNFELDITTSNEIPLSGSIDLHFKNAAGTTLITKEIELFGAAGVDITGKSNAKNISKTILEFNSVDIENLKNTTNVALQITFNSTEDATSVILAGSDTIKLSIGALVGVQITSEGDNE